jgi:hypothetical protein
VRGALAAPQWRWCPNLFGLGPESEPNPKQFVHLPLMRSRPRPDPRRLLSPMPGREFRLTRRGKRGDRRYRGRAPGRLTASVAARTAA